MSRTSPRRPARRGAARRRGGAAAARPAPRRPRGYCAKGTGVTVVVDNGPLGGGTSIGCDPSGANTAGLHRRAPGRVPADLRAAAAGLRVQGRRGARASASCGNTPPADAYWGLFWSDGKSGTWTYSSVGHRLAEGARRRLHRLAVPGQQRPAAPGAAPVSPAASAAPKPTSRSRAAADGAARPRAGRRRRRRRQADRGRGAAGRLLGRDGRAAGRRAGTDGAAGDGAARRRPSRRPGPTASATGKRAASASGRRRHPEPSTGDRDRRRPRPSRPRRPASASGETSA